MQTGTTPGVARFLFKVQTGAKQGSFVFGFSFSHALPPIQVMKALLFLPLDLPLDILGLKFGAQSLLPSPPMPIFWGSSSLCLGFRLGPLSL